ncbi:polysaccharide deacetylase family protein [Candidatus Sumerlaeota bacterium]|nr:polysaccharide deacetylase family protein [Candidatus Sumerlaeota bacterium]
MSHRALIIAIAPLLLIACITAPPTIPEQLDPAWTLDHGGVVRGDVSEKRIALIFTGGSYGDGADHILDVLARQGVRASMFVTGDYTAMPAFHHQLRRMVDEGHYLGPHSDAHLLYAPWEDRETSLVTEEEFRHDLEANIETLRGFGALQGDGPIHFIPPFEWFNEDQVVWARDMGILLFNFTPGIGSHRDWAPEGHAAFRPSQQIMEDILTFEETDPHGLNGALMLMHLGSLREDKMHLLLEPLIEELRARGYTFVRIDEMLPLGE